MGFWNDLTKPLNYDVMRRQIWFYTSKNELIEDLEFASSNLKIVYSSDKDSIYKFAKGLEDAIKILKLQETAVKNFHSAKKIVEAISALKKSEASAIIRKPPQLHLENSLALQNTCRRR